MDKLKMHTKSKVDVNIESIGALFPNTVTETIKGYDEDDNPIVEKAIDFDILKQELSKVIVEGREERYQMNWPGKKEAILTANAPINKTLRPCRADSVKFDETENLYIEGDNLEVLKLLQETYLNRVKMIYIDPPYNTGNDSFVYNDNFAMSNKEFSEASGQYDEDGNINYDIRKNNESNGKFHTDWLNMMYPRLKLAKDLLCEEGVIIISIDDNELYNIKKICDEIFGSNLFIATIPWRKRTAKSDVPFGVSQDFEWILLYAKSLKVKFRLEGKPRRYYTSEDFPNRPWRIHDMTKQTTASERPNSFFTMINPKNGDEYPADPNRTWRITKDTFQKYYDAGEIIFPGDYEFLKISKPQARYFKDKDMEKAGEDFGKVAMSTNIPNIVGMSQDGTKEMKSIFKNIIFPFPKPSSLIKYLLSAINDSDGIILDFFSGSATTAHAVMQLNAEDGGNRKFIMVQLPEVTDEKSEARKAGYENICEIGKERIRRAGKKIVEENPEVADKLDIGFRVLKLDSSNMKDVYYNPNEYTQDMLSCLESNIKDDRSSEDLLFQIMLDLGELLSSNIKEIDIEDKKVFNVGDGNIVACFDEEITNEVLTEIAKMQPLYAVFRDSSLSNDSVATNFEQIFKTYSPDTIRKVL